MMDNSNRPKIVVLTPVRNEAWILKAFLEATSLWADYIIIADQMSTDGSREISKSYPKVILIDNERETMHMAETRRLLFDAAKQIEGDKILFALDADEFLYGDFEKSESWRKIINSNPDDIFNWRWMNLKQNDATKYSYSEYFYWAVHESGNLWDGLFPDNFIHEWRLPWPKDTKDSNVVELKDFFSIHFGKISLLRQKNKNRFYQVSTVVKDKNASKVALYRQYHAEERLEYYDVPEDAFKYYEDKGIDIWSYVDLKDEGAYYSAEVKRYFETYGIKKFALLDIWDKEWMNKMEIKDPRTPIQKLIHKYLHFTMRYDSCLIVRFFDKLLKLVM